MTTKEFERKLLAYTDALSAFESDMNVHTAYVSTATFNDPPVNFYKEVKLGAEEVHGSIIIVYGRHRFKLEPLNRLSDDEMVIFPVL
jgi:hypothetical protein